MTQGAPCKTKLGGFVAARDETAHAHFVGKTSLLWVEGQAAGASQIALGEGEHNKNPENPTRGKKRVKAY